MPTVATAAYSRKVGRVAGSSTAGVPWRAGGRMDVRPDDTWQVRLRCFGELEVVRLDGTDVMPLFLLPRRAALFLYLALSGPPQPIPRGLLAEMFWPFLVAGTAGHALDQSLFSLRQYLGDVWDAVNDAVVFVRDPIWCDVWAFRDAIEACDDERAVALYRGPLLARPRAPSRSTRRTYAA